MTIEKRLKHTRISRRKTKTKTKTSDLLTRSLTIEPVSCFIILDVVIKQSKNRGLCYWHTCQLHQRKLMASIKG